MQNSELNKQQIDQLKTLLKEQKQTLETHLLQSETSTSPVILDQQSVGRVSRIDAIQQQQMAIAGHEQASSLLKLVELALQSIEWWRIWELRQL